MPRNSTHHIQQTNDGTCFLALPFPYTQTYPLYAGTNKKRQKHNNQNIGYRTWQLSRSSDTKAAQGIFAARFSLFSLRIVRHTQCITHSSLHTMHLALCSAQSAPCHASCIPNCIVHPQLYAIFHRTGFPFRAGRRSGQTNRKEKPRTQRAQHRNSKQK